jgi:maleylpyruvate isomerase
MTRSQPVLRLYGYWRSSCSWRVRIALALKELHASYEPVHLVKDGGEQHLQSYRARNPLRQVPTLELEDDGITRWLTQSLAICLYLDARWPDPPLVPADPWLGARAWQLAEIVNSAIQPLQNLDVMKRIKVTNIDPNDWSRAFIERGLDALEREAADVAGRYSVGDSPSIADLCLVPQLYNARRFGIDVASYPTLARVDAACMEHHAFQKTHPDEQPDAQASP